MILASKRDRVIAASAILSLLALLTGCGLGSVRLPSASRSSPPSADQPLRSHTPSAQSDGATAGTVAAGDREWAQQALHVLDTVDGAVSVYHASTALPIGSQSRGQMADRAYAGFHEALSQHQALWPATQGVKDSQVRDQFVFVLGNLSGFLNSTPDLVGDPPSRGDRIARSLENAVASSAAVRPKLQRIAGQH